MECTADIKNISKVFKHPISYVKNVKIPHHIKTDLELSEMTDDASMCLYDYVFPNANNLGKQTMRLWSERYTTNEKFLKDSQRLYKKLKVNNIVKYEESNAFTQAWLEIKENKYFCDHYHYVDWECFEFLNHNESFLQFLSVYSICSPAFALVLPVLMVIFPYALLKLKGIPITFGKYYEFLKMTLSSLPIGKLFYISEMSWDKRAYVLVTVMFYLFQIYQNVKICSRFYNNLTQIHNTLILTHSFNCTTIACIDEFLLEASELKCYSKFNAKLCQHREKLISLNEQLREVKEFNFLNARKNFCEIGHVRKCFYDLYSNKEVNELMMYSLGFHGYLNNIVGLQENLSNKKMHKCEYKKGALEFVGAYYAPLKDRKSTVKNSYDLNKSMVLTGPNAAGKTTLLKTTILNVLLCQQIGYGFFEGAYMQPFNFIHCYLNIPDTSGRDSLFQAEARRCKNILDTMEKYKDKRHFCVFDEIYSGTNPYEAVASAYSYLSHITKKYNVHFMLTTHYLELCNKLLSNERIEQFNMKINVTSNDNFIYEYKLQEGISNVKGGIRVLRDLAFPDEILDLTSKLL